MSVTITAQIFRDLLREAIEMPEAGKLLWQWYKRAHFQMLPVWVLF